MVSLDTVCNRGCEDFCGRDHSFAFCNGDEVKHDLLTLLCRECNFLVDEMRFFRYIVMVN